MDPKSANQRPSPPAVEPTGRPAPDGVGRPKGDDIEELNRQTQPTGPAGEPVDPHQERDPETAG